MRDLSVANQAVELHDSQVVKTTWSGRDLVLHLSAYLHQSEGRPDQDRGTGWTQEADLRVGMATLIEEPTASLWILDGTIEVGQRVFDNLLPMPFDYPEPVVVKLSGAEGTLHASGVGVSLTLLGNPVFVEDVPADDEER
jgi:hypothetical protein